MASCVIGESKSTAVILYKQGLLLNNMKIEQCTILDTAS